MSNIAKIETAWKLYQKDVAVESIASALEKDRSTIYRWISGIKKKGINKYIRCYIQAKHRPRKIRIDYRAERLIRQRRSEKDCCGQKIRKWLKDTHGIFVSVAQIYRILGKYFKLHGKCTKWTRRPKLPKAQSPREVIQVDTVHLGELYSFNFIDTYTREAISVIQAEITSSAAAYALEKAMVFFGGSLWIQTDNGSEYKGVFRKVAKRYCEHLRQITPFQKEENGFIESFNRTLRKECVGWRHYKLQEKDSLQQYVAKWLNEYHMERPHLSLNLMTPQEFVNSLEEGRIMA